MREKSRKRLKLLSKLSLMEKVSKRQVGEHIKMIPPPPYLDRIDSILIKIMIISYQFFLCSLIMVLGLIRALTYFHRFLLDIGNNNNLSSN